MQVILLETIRKLGEFGQSVKVANGYARNWLLPKGLAVLANNANLVQFEARRSELEKASLVRVQAAQERAAKLEGLVLVIPAHAADEGKLYGSVGVNEVLKALKALNHNVARNEVKLVNGAIREVGVYEVELHFHAEVAALISVEVVAE